MRKEKIPLLKDKHNHISIYSALFDCLDIQNTESKTEALDRIKDQGNDLSIVLGWNSGYYTFKDEVLDELQPLIICDLSLHDIRINLPAKKLLKNRYPELVDNLENKTWVEKNFPYIMKILVELKSLDVQKVNSLYDSLLEKGISYAADMLLPDENALEIINDSKMSGHTEHWADLDTYKELSSTGQKSIEGIKFFTDGAIGTNTAAIKDTYKNGGSGIFLYDEKELKDKLLEIIGKDKPVSIHTIGDEASEKVIDRLEKIEDQAFDLPYIRMEHCQFIDQNYARKAKDLGINICMQPTFSFDSVYYKDRLPEYYIENNNPFRMLIDDVGFEPGEDLFFGSDGMPHGVQYAIESSLFPPLENQRLKLPEFVKGYCVEDFKKGHVEVTLSEKDSKVKTDVVLK